MGAARVAAAGDTPDPPAAADSPPEFPPPIPPPYNDEDTQKCWDLAKNNKATQLKRLLRNGKPNCNKRGQGGQTPLMAAALSGADKSVAMLLTNGYDWTIGEQDGYTPMHGAAFQGRPKVAKKLLEHGLPPDDVHADGYQPIHRACWGASEGHTDVVKLLVGAGVDPEVPGPDGFGCAGMTKSPATRRFIAKAVKKRNEPAVKKGRRGASDGDSEL